MDFKSLKVTLIEYFLYYFNFQVVLYDSAVVYNNSIVNLYCFNNNHWGCFNEYRIRF